MERTIFGTEHHDFRQVVRDFYQKELVPQYPQWEATGHPPREFWRRAGELGLLGIQVPTEYGGAGEASFLFNAILTEESQLAGLALGGLRAHTDICLPYFLRYATTEQKQRWLPRLVSGDTVAALAISEPDVGSDMKAITTNAVPDGDSYLVNGAKTYISNGSTADLVITALKTSPDRGRDGVSLLVIETGTPGFEQSKPLRKLGLVAQDLGELSFQDVRVPAKNMLGEPDRGFECLVANLAQERLSVAVNSQAAAAAAIRTTTDYVSQRKAFGVTVGSFQNTKFELAACQADTAAGQALVDSALAAHERGQLTGADAAAVKLFCTELQGKVIDRCLQLHGGCGYMWETPIAKAYADARVSRIYAGSNEVMKLIIAKDMGLS